jgi:hypothetical protein
MEMACIPTALSEPRLVARAAALQPGGVQRTIDVHGAEGLEWTAGGRSGERETDEVPVTGCRGQAIGGGSRFAMAEQTVWTAENSTAIRKRDRTHGTLPPWLTPREYFTCTLRLLAIP